MKQKIERLFVNGEEALRREDFETALRCFSCLEKYYDDLGGANLNSSPWRDGLVGMLYVLGILHRRLGNFEEAVKKFRALVEILRQQGAAEDDAPLQPQLAEALEILGALLMNLNISSESEEAYRESVLLYQAMGAADERSPWQTDFIGLLTNQATLFARLGNITKAINSCTKAENFLREQGATNITSPLQINLAEVLMNKGAYHLSNEEYLDAKTVFSEAIIITQQVNDFRPSRRIKILLAGLLLNLGTVHFRLNAKFRAWLAYRKAAGLYRELSEVIEVMPGLESALSAPDLMWQVHWAMTLKSLGSLYESFKLFKKAEKVYHSAKELIINLGATESGSPLQIELVNLLVRQGSLKAKLRKSPRQDFDHALAICEGLRRFTGDFPSLLHELSHYLMHLPDQNSIHYFQCLVHVVENYNEQLILMAHQPDWREFWQQWLRYALSQQDSRLLLAVLVASYARRLSGLLQINLLQSQGLDAELVEFVDLKKKENQLGLDLDFSAKNNTDEASKSRYAEKLAVYRDAQTAWHNCRERLIAAGRYPDLHHAAFDLDQLQQRLSEGEAVLFSLSLSDYGLDEAPRLLLLSQSDLIDLVAPELQAAASSLNLINQLLQGCRSTLRKNKDQTENELSSLAVVPDLETLFTDLQQAMSQTWQQLQPHLADIKRLTVIGHGVLNGLPWQSYAPSTLDVRQYAGLYALQRCADSITYPDGNHPLAILAHADSENPQNHLHYVRAEAEMIARIWGNERVVNIDQLKDAPDGSLLLLLGHGGHSQGRAWFSGPHEHIDQFQIAIHSKPVHALCASSCLLGVTKDVNAEPLGLMSFAACRGDIHFAYGAVAPVDDLLATCLSLLFHLAWRKLKDPIKAMRIALKRLQTGRWPREAREVFKATYTAYLPELFHLLRTDAGKAKKMTDGRAIEERIEIVWSDWRRNNGALRPAVKILDGSSVGDIEAAAQTLAAAMLGELTKPAGHFEDEIEQFTRVWIWG